jgi:hypothetical protein
MLIKAKKVSISSHRERSEAISFFYETQEIASLHCVPLAMTQL